MRFGDDRLVTIWSHSVTSPKEARICVMGIFGLLGHLRPCFLSAAVALELFSDLESPLGSCWNPTLYDRQPGFLGILPTQPNCGRGRFSRRSTSSRSGHGFYRFANIASAVHIDHSAIAYWTALIWLGFFICVTFIVAALKSLHDRERQLSRVDSLTGIGNRLAFYEFASAERNRAGRSNQPITLAYLDLDGFKVINDTLGHQTGDKVLVSVARTMQISLRQTDMVARMGSDEFALILPGRIRLLQAPSWQKCWRCSNARCNRTAGG
jgi:GGDEF domain-containing protein